jgi:hypothetical protein
MRKIINSTYISIDGVIEEPHLWPPTGPDDETSGTIQTDLVLACDAVLMGRRTYEGTVIDGDPIEEIGRLKAEPGMDIVQYGFGRLSHAVMERDTTPLESGIVVLFHARP